MSGSPIRVAQSPARMNYAETFGLSFWLGVDLIELYHRRRKALKTKQIKHVLVVSNLLDRIVGRTKVRISRRLLP